MGSKQSKENSFETMLSSHKKLYKSHTMKEAKKIKKQPCRNLIDCLNLIDFEFSVADEWDSRKIYDYVKLNLNCGDDAYAVSENSEILCNNHYNIMIKEFKSNYNFESIRALLENSNRIIKLIEELLIIKEATISFLDTNIQFLYKGIEQIKLCRDISNKIEQIVEEIKRKIDKDDKRPDLK